MQKLSPDLQDMLGARMHPLRDVLCAHRNANMRWRFLYEKPSALFETAEIDRALNVIIDAYHEKMDWGLYTQLDGKEEWNDVK